MVRFAISSRAECWKLADVEVEKKGDESVAPRKHVTIMHGNLRLRVSLSANVIYGRAAEK
jgi:hypothetical protein